MNLPTEKSHIIRSLNAQNILIYGAPKVGKTTFAANFPNTLFLATESGHKHVEIYKIDVFDWETVREIGSQLINEKHSYKTLVIDITDWFYKYCENWVCKKHKVESPSDLAYGKGFSLVKDYFVRSINAFNHMGLSLVFLSHSKEREIKTKTTSWTCMGTSMTNSAEQIVTGISDIILYCYISSDGKRLIRTKPTKHILAGDRTKPGLPEIINMDFEQFSKYFEDKEEKNELATNV